MKTVNVTAVLPESIRVKINEVAANPGKYRDFFSDYGCMADIKLVPSDARIVRVDKSNEKFFNPSTPIDNDKKVAQVVDFFI